MSLKVGPIVAARLFLKDAKLPLVYIEAIANSMDWGATVIDIKVKVEDLKKPETLSIEIRDNGTGIDAAGFQRFSNLSKPLDAAHRGLGRLAFAANFNHVSVKSRTSAEIREFVFDEKFDDAKVKPKPNTEALTGTTLELTAYSKKTIHSHSFVRPDGIRDILLKTFFPTFYSRKKSERPLVISISLYIGAGSAAVPDSVSSIDVSKLPALKEVPFNPEPALLHEEMTLGYHIDTDYPGKLLIAGFDIDGRSHMVNAVSEEHIPINTKGIFILQGTYFHGRTDATRAEIEIDEQILRQLESRFAAEVDKLLKETMPQINETNQELRSEVESTFPHLETYFAKDVTGLINRDKLIEDATKKFMQDQRELLEADHLDSEEFEKAMDLSARLLMEYIVFREKTLAKLEEVSAADHEHVIHNLLVPKSKTYVGKGEEIYRNNAWVLDEKFMTYSYILSDQSLASFIEHVYPGVSTEGVSGEPDVAVLLSKKEEVDKKVDIVVVEMKRLGVEIKEEVHVVTQLTERAMAILDHFDGSAQRLWLYGIAEITERMKRLLVSEGWSPLYSAGEYWHTTKAVVPLNGGNPVPTSFYLMPYQTMVADAKLRNATFMNLLKRTIKRGGK